MLKTSLSRASRITGGIGLSHLLFVVLAGTTVLAAACSAEDPQHRGVRRGGESSGGEDGSDPSGSGTGSDNNDPAQPTNKGPEHNAPGFAAIAPILQTSCSECHHAGTWLDLQSGADAATADKIVHTLEQGTMPPAPRDAVSAGDIEKIKSWRDGGSPAAAAPVIDPPNAPVTQLLAANTLATYKAALPKVGWPRLQKILASSSSTLFWDKTAIPPAYQDTVGDGAGLPLGARFNNSGKGLIVQEGKKLFSDDGKTWTFPFGHTAGADTSTNTFIVDFMSLPAADGSSGGASLKPIAYKIETGSTGGLPIKRWNWSFPKGTIVGEIIMTRDSASSSSAFVTTEIRVRERYADKWATNSFRPFPSAKILSAAIKQKRANWQGTPDLAKVVGALDNNATLQAKSEASPAFANLVSLAGVVDAPLPDVNDDELVRDLLKTTTFVGAYGTSWKENGTQKAFGMTGPAAASAASNKLSFVPNGFDAGLLEVRESTCEKCHNQGGYFIGDLVDQAILYGDIWGVDRIFSFHPFEPTRIDASGNENRSVRAELSAIVVPYDASKHPAATYSFYRPTP